MCLIFFLFIDKILIPVLMSQLNDRVIDCVSKVIRHQVLLVDIPFDQATQVIPLWVVLAMVVATGKETTSFSKV